MGLKIMQISLIIPLNASIRRFQSHLLFIILYSKKKKQLNKCWNLHSGNRVCVWEIRRSKGNIFETERAPLTLKTTGKNCTSHIPIQWQWRSAQHTDHLIRQKWQQRQQLLLLLLFIDTSQTYSHCYCSHATFFTDKHAVNFSVILFLFSSIVINYKQKREKKKVKQFIYTKECNETLKPYQFSRSL